MNRAQYVIRKKESIAETCLRHIKQAKTHEQQLIAVEVAMNQFLREAFMLISKGGGCGV